MREIVRAHNNGYGKHSSTAFYRNLSAVLFGSIFNAHKPCALLEIPAVIAVFRFDKKQISLNVPSETYKFRNVIFQAAAGVYRIVQKV